MVLLQSGGTNARRTMQVDSEMAVADENEKQLAERALVAALSMNQLVCESDAEGPGHDSGGKREPEELAVSEGMGGDPVAGPDDVSELEGHAEKEKKIVRGFFVMGRWVAGQEFIEKGNENESDYRSEEVEAG
jgi:hypothetical protein